MNLNQLKKSVFFISVPFGIMSFLLPLYSKKLGASAIEIGYLFSIFSLLSVVIRPFIGKYMDRKDKKKFFLLGIVLYCIVQGVFAYSTSFSGLLIARSLQAVAASFYTISLYAMLPFMGINEQKARTIGEISIKQSRGEFLGFVIGFTLLFNGFPYKSIFLLFLITSIYSLVVASKDGDNNAVWESGIEEDGEPWHFAFNKTYIKYLLIILVISTSMAILYPVYILFVQEHITSNVEWISYCFLPGTLLWNILPNKMGSLSDRYGRKPMMIIGLVISGIFIMVLPMGKTIGMFALLYAFISFGAIIVSPAMTAIATDMNGNEKAGETYGLYFFANGLGSTLGPLLGGWLYEEVSSTLPFVLSGMMLALGACLVWWIIQEKKTEKDEIF